MHAVGSSLTSFSSTGPSTVDRREFDLAVREAELKRREAAVENAEHAAALPRVQAMYFAPGENADEDDWWAKQLGSR
jgi:hypothetical protein